MSVGVLGGTFDPIHLGHLRAAESVREGLGLERVLLVPAGRPPHRPTPAASAVDRYAMACLAAAGHPALTASDAEILRDEPSYTVHTVERLKERYPQETLVLIVGSDTLGDVGGWHESERLLRLCTLAVVARPGSSPAPDVPGGRVQHVGGATLPISASDVRAHVRAGRSVRYLVPDAVAEYIHKKGLYS